MKNLFKISIIFFCFLIANETIAQVPQGMNYQATVRSAAGELMTNQSVTVIFDIRGFSESGASIYNETHIVTTNDFGGFSAIIGDGTVNSGNMYNIVWSDQNHFLNVNVDGDDLGTSKFQHVPYAFHSSSADNITDPLWERENTVEISTQNRVLIGATINDNEILKVNADALTAGDELVDFYVDNLTTNEDVLNLEVGVASTYNAQFIECRYAGDVHFKVDVDGTTLVNQVNTTATGDANLLPIAYGNVSASGVVSIAGSTENVNVTKTSTGLYAISVTSETMNANGYSVQVSPQASFSGPIISNYEFPSSGINAGNLFVYSYSISGSLIDNAFSFSIYKP